MNGLASKFSDANLGSGSSTTTDISRARTSSTLPLADPKRSLSEEDKTLAIKIHALLLNAKGPVKASVITKKLTDKQRLEKPTVNRVLYAYEDIYFVIDPDPPYWKLVCDF